MVKAGILQATVNGERVLAKGSWTYNLGRPMREPITGADGFHGFKETPQPARIEGSVTRDSATDIDALLALEDATVQLNLRDGTVVVLRNASFAGQGDITTEEGEITVAFIGKGAEEIRP